MWEEFVYFYSLPVLTLVGTVASVLVLARLLPEGKEESGLGVAMSMLPGLLIGQAGYSSLISVGRWFGPHLTLAEIWVHFLVPAAMTMTAVSVFLGLFWAWNRPEFWVGVRTIVCIFMAIFGSIAVLLTGFSLTTAAWDWLVVTGTLVWLAVFTWAAQVGHWQLNTDATSVEV